MHRGAYHDPNAGRETFGAFWQAERIGASRTGRLSERILIAYDEIVRLYLARLDTAVVVDHESRRRGCDPRTNTRDGHQQGNPRHPGPSGEGREDRGEPSRRHRCSEGGTPRAPRTLSGEELDRLVDAMPDRYKALILVASVVRARRASRRSSRPSKGPDPGRGEDRRVRTLDPWRAEDRTKTAGRHDPVVRHVRDCRALAAVSVLRARVHHRAPGSDPAAGVPPLSLKARP
jgi:hypothetical protein